MTKKLKLLVIDPHPDDEAFFFGGTLVKYSREGVEVYLLVLSNGEKGTVRGKAIKQTREPWLAAERQRECLKAAKILGINQENVEFLGFPNLGIDYKIIPTLESRIELIDPHVIITFSEAGTTRPSNQDHSWTGISTFLAIKSMLKRGSCPPSFRRFLTYTLPTAARFLEEWAEMNLLPRELTRVDVSNESMKKCRACASLLTQAHLVNFFRKVGILNLSHEIFYERINLSPLSCKGKSDLFFGINEQGADIKVPPFPESLSRYSSSDVDFYKTLRKRCLIASQESGGELLQSGLTSWRGGVKSLRC